MIGDALSQARGDGPRSARTLLVPALLAFGAAALYLPRLQDAPLYPQRDELYFALTAQAIATSAHDPSGLFLPIYFPIGPPGQPPLMWFQPMLMYAIALLLKVLPLTEATIRLPIALAAIADVVLMYAVAKRLTDRTVVGVAAAVLLALAPAHFVFGRWALDYQLPVPFILGWLWCVLRYADSGDVQKLFAGGLVLGFGLYTYIAADLLMPVYVLLTGLMLFTRRAPRAAYAALAAGFCLPAAIGAVFLLFHPSILRDVVLRYEPAQSQTADVAGTIGTFVGSRRPGDILAVYRSFWNPRLLFIDGHAMLTGIGGAFLLPVAGALAVGVARALRRFDAASILLLGGLLTAAVPASFVNKPEAIRRALALTPFVILLAAYGLDAMWSAPSSRRRRISFVAVWSVLIALVTTNREYLAHAQALIRAATVPLLVVGLALLVRRVTVERPPGRRLALVATISLAFLEIAYSVLAEGAVVVATVAMLILGAAATALPGRTVLDRPRSGSTAATALLVLTAAEFVYFYVGFPVHRVGMIPASAQLAAVRFAAAFGVLGAAVALATASRRLTSALSRTQLTVAAAVAFVVVQLAYFHVDYFEDYRARLLHVAAVAIAVIVLATLPSRRLVARTRLAYLGTVMLLAIAAIQSVDFLPDYFAGFQIRSSGEFEGNVRAAYESLLEQHVVGVPAVYLANRMEFAWLREIYWRFYALKRHRPEILASTVNAPSAHGLDVDRLEQLPRGSFIVADVSSDWAAVIDRRLRGGTVRLKAMVNAADGAPVFWILCVEE